MVTVTQIYIGLYALVVCPVALVDYISYKKSNMWWYTIVDNCAVGVLLLPHKSVQHVCNAYTRLHSPTRTLSTHVLLQAATLHVKHHALS